MNRNITRMLILVSIMTFSVSACSSQPVTVGKLVDTSGLELLTGGQLEVRPTSGGNTDRGTSVESSQAFQAAAPVEETIGDIAPKDVPSLDERNAILDLVNQGGPLIFKDGQVPVEGPAPGTESGLAPGEVLEDILDRVNPEGPDLSESDGSTGEGPALGTESVAVTGSSNNTIDDTDPGLLSRFLNAFGNWLRGFFNQSGE